MVPSQLSNLHMALSSTTVDNLEHLLQGMLEEEGGGRCKATREATREATS